MITEEDNLKHIKNVKKIKKEIKKCNMTTNFNTYLLLAIIAIILLIFCMPSVNAANVNTTFAVRTGPMVMGQNYTVSYGPDAICAAYGRTVHPAWVGKLWIAYYRADSNPTNSNLPWRYSNQLSSYPTNYTPTYNNIQAVYVSPEAVCDDISTGSLEYSAYYNSSIYIPNEISFTAVPQSGNQSLSVLFTPSASSPSFNRIVWDFDGGLGTETNTTYPPLPFTKIYNTAGHFVARAMLYDNSSNTVSASKNIDVYNYTLGITPTPTLTPTPTPTPHTNTTSGYTVILANITDSAPVNGVSIALIDVDDTGSGWFNVTATSDRYTFNGYGSGQNKPFVQSHTYMFTFTKTGYKTESNLMQLGTIPVYTGMWYLTPTQYAPSASSFVLGVNLYSQANNQPVLAPLGGTVTITNQSSAWSSTVTTPQSNALMFGGLTPSHSYKIDINLNGYKSYTGYFASSSGMTNTNQWFRADLEPSNNLPSSYTLSVSPNQGTINTSYTLTTGGDLTNAKSISYKYGSSSYQYPFTVGSYQSIYQKVGGAWKIWDGSAWQASSLPQSITGKMNTISGGQVYSVNVYITTMTDETYTASSYFNLVQNGQIKVRFNVWDGSASMTQIFPHNVMVYDRANAIWINKTITSLQDIESSYFFINANTPIQYKASALNYKESDLQSETLGAADITRDINLIPIGTLTGSNVTLFANVRDGSAGYMTIPHALITFNEGVNTSTCYTGSNGQCSIVARAPVSYSITASGITGYSSATTTYNTTTTGNNVAYLTLMPTGAIVTRTFSPVVTGTVKVTPTFTNTSGVNTTPREEVFCNTQTENMNIYQVLMNNVACMGIEGGEAQGFVLAGLIMFVFAMGLSKFGGGVGSLGGIIIGAVIGWGMRLLPFWTLIVVMIICGLMFSKMLISSTNGS